MDHIHIILLISMQDFCLALVLIFTYQLLQFTHAIKFIPTTLQSC